eukprot:3766910-Ditylum_brightwellii.AAC.1
MVAGAMIVAKLLSLPALILFALLTRNASSVALSLAFAPLVTWLDRFFLIRLFMFLQRTSYPFLKRLLQLGFF